jgi:gluconolactonase
LKVPRSAVVACAAAFALAGQGCGGGGSTGSGSAGSGGGSTGTAGTTGAAGTTGTGGSSTGGSSTGTGGSATGSAGTTGTGGATGTAGTTGTGGSATGAAGTTGTGGTTGAGGGPGSGGRGGAGGSIAGGAGRGGATGSAGSGGAAGSAGTGGATGTAGTGGSTAGHGSAAKNICPQGQTFGNPLTGMGTIQQITPTNPDYFAFIEGPIWIAGLGTVFFSDNATSPERIWKVVPPSTMPTQFVMNSGSNGLAVDNSDRIVAADQRNKRIATFDPMTGQIVGTPISTGSAKPNDVIVRSDNNIYFTDPATGFYRIAPGGTTPSAAMKLPNNGGQPNGIELSLDENTLIVGDVAQQKIFKFTLAADGSVMTSTGAELVSQTMRTTVDGMCTDCAGNIYAGTQGAIEVYSPTGSYLGSIVTNLQTSNCTFGGADRKTLYMTTPAALKYVTLNVPGLPD